MNCFHINTLLDYIKEKEGVSFKIIKSKDYGINGILAFTAIIPEYFEVDKVNIKEDEYNGYTIEVKDKTGRNAIKEANIVFWNSELMSSESEENVYVWLDEVDNGLLVFDNFKKIPEYIGSEEILEFIMKGRK